MSGISVRSSPEGLSAAGALSENVAAGVQALGEVRLKIGEARLLSQSRKGGL